MNTVLSVKRTPRVFKTNSNYILLSFGTPFSFSTIYYLADNFNAFYWLQSPHYPVPRLVRKKLLKKNSKQRLLCVLKNDRKKGTPI